MYLKLGLIDLDFDEQEIEAQYMKDVRSKLIVEKREGVTEQLKTSVVEAEKRMNRASIDSEVFELATRHHTARLFWNPIMRT